MAIVTIPGGVLLPTPVWVGPTTPAYSALSSLTTTAATNYAVRIVRMPKAGTLATVGFRTGTVTTPQDLRVSFQDVNTTTGLPDLTADQFRDVPLASLTANTWITTGLVTSDGTDGGVKRTVAAGDVLAIVIVFASTAGSLQIVDASTDEQSNMGYSLTVGGTKRFRCNTFFVTYDDGSYAQFVGAAYPWSAFVNTGLTTIATPDEAGNAFTLPFGGTVDGCWIKASLPATCTVVLYDSDGTSVLAQTGTQTVGLLASNNPTPFGLPFTSAVTLIAGATYRLVLAPSTTTTVNLHGFDVPLAAAMGAVELGTTCVSTSRTDAGAWTDLATRRYFMGLRVSGIDASSGGGGGGGSYTFVG